MHSVFTGEWFSLTESKRKRPGLHSSLPLARVPPLGVCLSAQEEVKATALQTHTRYDPPSRVRWAIPESRGASLIGMINIVVIGDTFLNGSSLSPGRALGSRAKAKRQKKAARPSAADFTLCWWAGLSSGHSWLVDCSSILRSCWLRCLVLHCRLPFGFSGSPWRRKRPGKVQSGSGEGEEEPTDLRCSLRRCRLSERWWGGMAEENLRMESLQKLSERAGMAGEKDRDKERS